MTVGGAAVLSGDSLIAVDGSVTPLPPSDARLVAWQELDFPGHRGVELPLGWVLRVEHFAPKPSEMNVQACGGRFVAFNLSDATIVPLPVLGEPAFCG